MKEREKEKVGGGQGREKGRIERETERIERERREIENREREREERIKRKLIFTKEW